MLLYEDGETTRTLLLKSDAALAAPPEFGLEQPGWPFNESSL
jgi:hypothetical protein